ncbi:hypothetical protein FHS51_002858 [Sphingobium wenxiniae]|jgi:hypothetical protein|uniref:Uncharacterized protein n=2 Tax=Sphingomonadaceae TaxID=41297 RepID=A0A562KAB5_SPHWJ|nr:MULTISPECIES: hypothetical protein [Sphingomonadaceae]MBB6192605.1 hypothetical protein [Sphingobium wenxiniae]QSR20533.1 hypothetical protein CA833_25770 [Novosphingobium sp. KA1]TWH92224.1 hypothetical protein IQ35_02750 [Sphingobium wenxiniae]BAF03347.1 hypothetical protein [Novosphingobium sp. KA1]GEO01951.1 hypothetical protein NSE01_37830 [Novosphingobium sediminis]
MPHSTVTPETVFCPKPASLGDSVFCFGQAAPRLSEQEQYKRLIDAEAGKQGLPLAHLADRLEIARPRLHKVIRKKVALKDDLRDRLFEALDIDCVRAKFCVTFLHDHTAYDDPEVFLICEAMKGFYCEILTRRRGEIQVTLRPPIIHEALGRAYDMLLSHQERVMEHDRTLQA